MDTVDTRAVIRVGPGFLGLSPGFSVLTPLVPLPLGEERVFAADVLRVEKDIEGFDPVEFVVTGDIQGGGCKLEVPVKDGAASGLLLGIKVYQQDDPVPVLSYLGRLGEAGEIGRLDLGRHTIQVSLGTGTEEFYNRIESLEIRSFTADEAFKHGSACMRQRLFLAAANFFRTAAESGDGAASDAEELLLMTYLLAMRHENAVAVERASGYYSRAIVKKRDWKDDVSRDCEQRREKRDRESPATNVERILRAVRNLFAPTVPETLDADLRIVEESGFADGEVFLLGTLGPTAVGICELVIFEESPYLCIGLPHERRTYYDRIAKLLKVLRERIQAAQEAAREKVSECCRVILSFRSNEKVPFNDLCESITKSLRARVVMPGFSHLEKTFSRYFREHWKDDFSERTRAYLQSGEFVYRYGVREPEFEFSPVCIQLCRCVELELNRWLLIRASAADEELKMFLLTRFKHKQKENKDHPRIPKRFTPNAWKGARARRNVDTVQIRDIGKWLRDIKSDAKFIPPAQRVFRTTGFLDDGFLQRLDQIADIRDDCAHPKVRISAGSAVRCRRLVLGFEEYELTADSWERFLNANFGERNPGLLENIVIGAKSVVRQR